MRDFWELTLTRLGINLRAKVVKLCNADLFLLIMRLFCGNFATNEHLFNDPPPPPPKKKTITSQKNSNFFGKFFSQIIFGLLTLIQLCEFYAGFCDFRFEAYYAVISGILRHRFMPSLVLANCTEGFHLLKSTLKFLFITKMTVTFHFKLKTRR